MGVFASEALPVASVLPDLSWEAVFAVEAIRLRTALGPALLAVEHIGSTAVPGLPARPILDIGVAVSCAEERMACLPLLQPWGYAYRETPSTAWQPHFVCHRSPPIHLYLYPIGSREWEDLLLFRDYLRAEPAAARRYAACKQAWVAGAACSELTCRAEKSACIAAVLATARAWQRRRPLDTGRLAYAVQVLAHRDPHFAAIVAAHGPPPLWQRPPGFATLLAIILEQQVSLASAQATFRRLLALTNPLSPATFLALDDATLRAIGFSRQKTLYGRVLARALLAGELDLASLTALDDGEAVHTLTRLKGIGRWTATIYLLEALLRPDVWPVDDVALAAAVQKSLGLSRRPDPSTLAQMAEPWRPWRGVAARLFWHAYLEGYWPETMTAMG